MKKIFLFILICGLIVGYSQENKAKKEEQPKPQQTPKAATADEELQQEIDPNIFTYKPMGRRDPFKSLLTGAERPERKLEGVAGLTISELVLEGIVGYGKGKYKAYVRGPKNRPYSITVGDKVYDGEVAEITNNSVTFKQILTVVLGGTKERPIVKYLNPEEEANKK